MGRTHSFVKSRTRDVNVNRETFYNHNKKILKPNKKALQLAMRGYVKIENGKVVIDDGCKEKKESKES